MEGDVVEKYFILMYNGGIYVFLYYSSDIEDEKVYKNWKKFIMLVWRLVVNYKLVWMKSGFYVLCRIVLFYEYRFRNICLCIK